jgi:Cu(I)/Ag(I) efflux system membrane fusion protein
MEIVSPVSGYVIFKSVLEGSHVKPGETLFRIADTSEVWLLADIYESDIPFIKVGQKAKITVTSLPGKKLTGKITYLYPYLSPQTRSMKVRIELENPDGKLKPEMYAKVRIEVKMGKRLSVPQSAVLDSGLRKLVFIRTGAGMYAPREIETGNPVGNYRPVLSGLKEGEVVVSSAAFFLDSESKLTASMEGMMGLIGMGDWKMEAATMSEMDMGNMDMKGMGMDKKKMAPSSGEKK